MRWSFRNIALILLAIVTASAGLYDTTRAFPAGGVYGRGEYRGYFSNTYDNGGTSVLPIISGGLAIPNNINTVGEYVALLRNANNSGSNQRKTGSAFIVHTMLGRDGAARTRNISNADWNDLTSRLNARAANGKILWTGNVTNCVNSFWQGVGNSYDGGQVTNDDAYYDNCKGESGIRFLNDNGTIAYELLRRCANPMGNTPGLPDKPPDVPKPPVNPAPGNGNAYGCKPMIVKVKPGKDANGDYVPVKVYTTVRNLGTYSAPATIDVTSDHTTGKTYTVYFKETRKWISNYKPVKDPNNGAIIRWDPVYSAPRSWTDSIGPCYDYSLTPLVDLNGQTTVESGGSARVNNSVSNSGPTKTPDVDWRLTRMIFSPGTTLSASQRSAKTNNSGPCGSFTSAGRTACDIVQENATKVFPVGTSNYTPIYNYIAATDLATGTQVCFTVGVSRPTEDNTPKWRHSELLCLIVSKKPKFQVHGGDIRVGGKIETGISTVTNGASTKSYGSWVEYGSLSIGANNGFASGSGLNNGGPAAPSAWNRLTFANIDDSGSPSYGYYALPPRAASLVSQFTAATPVGAAISNLGALNSGTYNATNLTIGPSTVGQDTNGKGKAIIVIATGTVTISGDITYVGNGGSDTFTNLNQVPQVVIIASNINIQGSAENINAWLVTSGTNGAVNTCSDLAPTVALNSNVCDTLLQINGPVITSHLYLRRTAGADDGNRSGDPAEIFNLRADAYTWAHGQSSDAGKAQTVYTNELPPRF